MVGDGLSILGFADVSLEKCLVKSSIRLRIWDLPVKVTLHIKYPGMTEERVTGADGRTSNTASQTLAPDLL